MQGEGGRDGGGEEDQARSGKKSGTAEPERPGAPGGPGCPAEGTNQVPLKKELPFPYSLARNDTREDVEELNLNDNIL